METVVDDPIDGIGRADGAGAVANTIAKVGVGAEADGVGLAVDRRATKVTSLSKHVVDASLLKQWSVCIQTVL